MFKMGLPKEAAVKVLEEASEAFVEWQNVDLCGSPEQCNDCEVRETCDGMIGLANELADCIQACVNLASRYGIDLTDAMERCETRNRWRHA